MPQVKEKNVLSRISDVAEKAFNVASGIGRFVAKDIIAPLPRIGALAGYKAIEDITGIEKPTREEIEASGAPRFVVDILYPTKGSLTERAYTSKNPTSYSSLLFIGAMELNPFKPISVAGKGVEKAGLKALNKFIAKEGIEGAYGIISKHILDKYGDDVLTSLVNKYKKSGLVAFVKKAGIEKIDDVVNVGEKAFWEGLGEPTERKSTAKMFELIDKVYDYVLKSPDLAKEQKTALKEARKSFLARTVELQKRLEAGKLSPKEFGKEFVRPLKGSGYKAVDELPKIVQDDIDELIGLVVSEKPISPWDLISLRGILKDKIAKGIPITAPWEKRLINRVFGETLAGFIEETTTHNKTLASKLADILNDALVRIPRSIQTTADLSATFAQLFTYSLMHPTKVPKLILTGIKSFSEKEAKNISLAIKANPFYDLAKSVGVDLPEPTRAQIEEVATSDILKKVPMLKQLVEIGERSYNNMVSFARMDIFNKVIDDYIENGLVKGTPDEIASQIVNDINLYYDFVNKAKVINAVTGRGSIDDIFIGRILNWANKELSDKVSKEELEALSKMPTSKAVREINKIIRRSSLDRNPVFTFSLYSPRFWASKISALDPTWWYKVAWTGEKLPLVIKVGNKQILRLPLRVPHNVKLAFRYTWQPIISSFLLIYPFMKAQGYELETNPASPHFMKFIKRDGEIIKIFDPSGKRFYLARFLGPSILSAIFGKEYKSIKSGKEVSLKDFGMKGLFITNAFRKASSPFIGTIADLFFGEDIIGREITPRTLLGKLYLPLSFSEFVVDGVEAGYITDEIAESILNSLGINYVSFVNEDDPKRRALKVLRSALKVPVYQRGNEVHIEVPEDLFDRYTKGLWE